MKAVMTQSLCPEGLALLGAEAELCVANDGNPNHYPETMADADILIVRIGKCDAAAMESSPNLKVIGRTGVGYDSVDVKRATELGIPVVITPGANNRSVAEHTVALLFALAKNLVEGQSELSTGNWKIRDAGKAFELEGKTVGILGFGAIGRETGKLCRGIGMEVSAYDPFLTREQAEAFGVKYCETCEQLLREADAVTIHVPLIDATRNMIAREQFAIMKKTAVLINCSRGGIVNEADLVEALQNGVIAGAATDVYVEEPPAADHPLLRCPNLICSPHSAAQTREAVVKMATMCVNGCLAVCRGERWPYVADPKVYEHPRWENKP